MRSGPRLRNLAAGVALAALLSGPVQAQTATDDFVVNATSTATGLSVSHWPQSAPTGYPVTLVVSPVPLGSSWASNIVLTPSSTLPGTFLPPSVAPIAGSPNGVTFSFVPTAAGAGRFTVTAQPGQVATTPATTPPATTTPASTPPATTTPSTTSDSTLAGIPSSTVAGQPLASTTVAAGSTVGYFVLWNVAAGAEEGLRFSSGAMNGTLFLLTPQNAGAYIIRGYDAASGGNKAYESAQFNVTAAPGPLPSAVAGSQPTSATASSVTFNWTASTGGTSYRFLARAGVGAAYGSLADATVSSTSYNLTGLAPNSSPRAVVVPRNANGSGPASVQIIAFTAGN